MNRSTGKALDVVESSAGRPVHDARIRGGARLVLAALMGVLLLGGLLNVASSTPATASTSTRHAAAGSSITATCKARTTSAKAARKCVHRTKCSRLVKRIQHAATKKERARITKKAKRIHCAGVKRLTGRAATQAGATTAVATTATTSSTGVPGPTNTGVPAGVQLKVHSGDVVVRTAGTVISGLDVRGTISVYAANVTIKNTIVRFGAKAPAKGVTVAGIHSYSTGLKVIDSEVAATTPTPDYTGVMGSGFTLTRVDIHDVVDPVHVATYNPVVVQDSWLHDNSHWTADPNWGGKPSHDDSIQIVAGKSVKILRNSISGAYNSGIQFNQSASKSVSDVLVSQNTMGGGGCTVNIAPSDRPMAGLVFSDNKFRHDQRVKDCAFIGVSSNAGTVTRNNTWLGTTTAVRVR